MAHRQQSFFHLKACSDLFYLICLEAIFCRNDPVKYDLDPVKYDLNPVKYDLDPVKYDLNPVKYDL